MEKSMENPKNNPKLPTGSGEKAEPKDRDREGFGLPSLRTVRAVLPHTALQSWLSSSGGSRFLIGCV
jgi:hypothetical protein